jgi:hypothetical protein
MNMLDADDRTKKYSLPFKGGVFRMSTVKWPNWYVYMESSKEGNARGWGGVPGYQGEFVFTPHGEDNLYLISPKSWPTWHLYMEDDRTGNVRGKEGSDPGEQGHWRIKPRHDGSFMLSTAKWEHWHMYMQDNAVGNVRGYGGDPGPQGHFVLSCDVRLSLEEGAGSLKLNNTL